MRLFKLLSLLGLFFWARASSLKTRHPASHPLDARQLSNVCALLVNAVLDVPDTNFNFFSFGPIDACLCTSTLQNFVQTDPVTSTAASQALNGASTVIDELTDLIIVSAPDSNCNYPANSSPACVGQDPCGFTCTDGFTASPPGSPATCVCAAPSVVCNGHGTCAEMGPEWAACGVFGGGLHSWECINTARDLESCGGCMLPLTPYVPIGQDCTSLPGVADVACIAGECVVHRCLSGYVRARDGNHCVSRHGKISQHSEYDEDDDESVPARVYGLKHVPLRKRKH
ncbi:hypothetical protein BGW80DRAFT_1559478 [Lactifluus volemus]|nr:hypothetical protein BGW80DRAFT_1559478 [Lactifluus volemus]